MSQETIGRADDRPAPPLPLDRERELVARAGRDVDAFAELYRHYLPRIHAFAWRRTGDTMTAEDISSATFESALRSLPSFRWRRAGFAPWLFRIASNQIIAHYRREGRPASDRGQRAMADLHRPVHHDDSADPDGLDPDLMAALGRMNPRYQEALSLRYLADLDHGQAAAAMAMTKPAFAVVLSRAGAALRRELDRP